MVVVWVVFRGIPMVPSSGVVTIDTANDSMSDIIYFYCSISITCGDRLEKIAFTGGPNSMKKVSPKINRRESCFYFNVNNNGQFKSRFEQTVVSVLVTEDSCGATLDSYLQSIKFDFKTQSNQYNIRQFVCGFIPSATIARGFPRR